MGPQHIRRLVGPRYAARPEDQLVTRGGVQQTDRARGKGRSGLWPSHLAVEPNIVRVVGAGRQALHRDEREMRVADAPRQLAPAEDLDLTRRVGLHPDSGHALVDVTQHGPEDEGGHSGEPRWRRPWELPNAENPHCRLRGVSPSRESTSSRAARGVHSAARFVSCSMGSTTVRFCPERRNPRSCGGSGSSGGGIRTRDLRVMSPTSYLTAPPRVASSEVTNLFRPPQPAVQGFLREMRRPGR